MPYEANLNTAGLTKVADMLERQIPFAAMKSLNEMATSFQDAERQGISARMTIRRPWVLQGVKIERGDFATKDKLSVRVHVDESRGFLDKFEPGGARTPITSRSLSVPEGARVSKQATIPQGLRPKALGFREISGASLATHAAQLRDRRLKGGVLRGAFRVYEGDKRTFLIQTSSGTGVILQRVGRSGGRMVKGVRVGAHDPGVIVLYSLRLRTSVPRSLRFYETANAQVKRWPDIFRRWYAEAVRTAR